MARLHLNLHDPHTRQRVLLAAAALGLLVAVAWSRSRRASSATAPTDTGVVGATTDPTTGDAFPGASGVPSMLDGGISGVTPVTSDQVANAVQQGLAGIDWGGLFSPVTAAVSSLAAAVAPSDSGATTSLAAPVAYTAPTLDPNQFTVQQLAALGAPSAGPSPFDPATTLSLAHFFGSMTPAQLTALGVGPQPGPNAPVNIAPRSGVATPTPAPAPLPVIAPKSTAAPAAYKPQTSGVRVAAVSHPSANVTLTHLSNGTVIEQVKGKTPYVVKRG